ncbi:bifunctional folylpolyglutamate synthase/dihydrofolate synthase [Rhodocaloribacter litoris]|uniref:bifunctional folylpolyglutamate synthase/dihydrofolate synthase n=1 Tax=Rhodocaloribacter litoris TaxID=2558931 RepID=UPI001E39BBDE|nr:folylpolyglutamate synthase/dihydrofolate synthase family protein [Rhodocaloribacter litoris]
MTIAEAHAYLLALPQFAGRADAAYKPGLERIAALLEAMGRPHEAYPSVHVAGTNGKGSTASMIAAVATAAGRRTGLHTSPHLFRLNERMRLDGVPVPDAWLTGAVARYRTVFEAVGPSFFEATVALSLLYFAEAGAELAVVEVGLGGRLDATNILRPRLAVITPIGLDHTAILGATLPAIAREKAGIIKPGVPVVSGVTQPEVLAVLRDVADRQGAPLHHVPDEVACTTPVLGLDGVTFDARTPVRFYERLHVGLAGAHQRHNAAVALRAAELLLAEVREDPAPVYTGLREVRRHAGLRGRLEVLQEAPRIVADVAHNADGLAVALAFLQATRPPGGRLFALFGVMRDKDVPPMADAFAAHDVLVYPVSSGGARALPARELRALLRARGVRVALPEAPDTVPAGLAWFRRRATERDALLVTGSHQTVTGLPEALWCSRQAPA